MDSSSVTQRRAVFRQRIVAARSFVTAVQSATRLFDAIKTVATAPVGAHAIFADAIDDKTAACGFTPLLLRPRTLYLPVATALSPLSP